MKSMTPPVITARPTRIDQKPVKNSTPSPWMKRENPLPLLPCIIAFQPLPS